MDRESTSDKEKHLIGKDIPSINSSEYESDSIQIIPAMLEEALKSKGSVSIVPPSTPEHENEVFAYSSSEEDSCSSGSSRAQHDENELTENISQEISIDSRIKAPKIKTLESAIKEFKDNETFIEFQKRFVNEDIDLSNLSKTLQRKDGCGLVYSIFWILNIKAEPFCLKALNEYLLCLSNIFKYLHKSTINSEILELLNKLKYFIFDLEKSFHEKDYCIRKLKGFFSNNNGLFDGWKVKEEFIGNLFRLNISMKICFSRKNFQSGPENVEEVISSEIQDLTSINLFQNLELRDLYFECLKRHCAKLGCLSPNLLALIDSNKTPVNLPISYEFAQQIEAQLLAAISKYLAKEVKLSTIKTISELLNEYYSQQIEEYYSGYLKTHVNRIPDIDKSFCWSLSNLLKLPLKSFLIKLYKSEAEFFREKYMITSLVSEFSKFPIKIQYIFVEMLSRIDVNDYSHLDFLATKMNKNLRYSRIKKIWAEDFIEIASSAPFAEILERFNMSDISLKEQLKKFTRNITLMELPPQLYGFTLFNLNLVITRFINSSASKGVTFVIYLHELAHILQRLSSLTIDDSSHVRTQDNFNVSEAGYLVEALIFGNQLFHITDRAAQFLVSKKIPDKLDQFQAIFKENNEIIGNEKAIALNRSSSILPLGGCLSLSRNVK